MNSLNLTKSTFLTFKRYQPIIVLNPPILVLVTTTTTLLNIIFTILPELLNVL
jgi:hypothetical protein